MKILAESRDQLDSQYGNLQFKLSFYVHQDFSYLLKILPIWIRLRKLVKTFVFKFSIS